MKKKIFGSMFILSVIILSICFISIGSYMYSYFADNQAKQISDILNIATNATEKFGKNYLSEFKHSQYRLTWIDKDGTVIFDSKFDEKDMENHISRSEIQEALLMGNSTSDRLSKTAGTNYIYKAKKLNDNSVLRISIQKDNILTIISDLLYPFIIIFILMVLLSTILVKYSVNLLLKPLKKIDLDTPLDNNTYKELSPFLSKIYNQQEQINAQIKNVNQKRNELQQIISNMQEALILIDSNKNILKINNSALRLFNKSENIIGKNFIEINRSPELQEAINNAINDKVQQLTLKLNGIYYLFNISKISSNKNNKILILAFDITAQINAEKNRREFTANVSHELKTPLQTIIGSAELIKNNIVKPEDLNHFINIIHIEAVRLINIIQDIIQLSQLDEEAELPKENIYISDIVNEVISNLKNFSEQKNIKISYTGNAHIYGIKKYIYSILYNLTDNAIKYNKINGSIHIDISEHQDKCIISINDTGIGIPIKHHNRIFERFYRVDKSHSKNSGGTGLGLSIVKRAVQYHNGSIEITSEENVGTTIKIFLPK